MPIRKPKPTSPGRRFVSYPDFGEITKREPEKSLVEGLTKSGGRNAHGRKTSRHRGGGAKRAYRRIDFKRRKDGVPAKVAGDRVRPQPLRVHRAAALRRRREALHPRAHAPARRHDRRAPARTPTSRSATACALARMPVGTVVHNVELQPGRGGQLARSAGASRAADGEGRRHGDAAPALRRDAHGARRVPRDGRRDRQRRPPEREGRQGRPQAPHGRAPADARHGDEPRRPPARRRRGLDDRRPPSGHAVGRADARLPHAQEAQAVRPLHRARPPPREGQQR